MDNIDELTEKIRLAQSVILSTHRHADGDGLGSQVALYCGLKKLGKMVRAINVDTPPQKYRFLKKGSVIEVYKEGFTVPNADLAIILDTNDGRLVEPLMSAFQDRVKEVIFIDHHPVLESGPRPTASSLIDVRSASTGQLCYHLLKKLGCEFDADIARALYTSLVFDTQLFRFVKSDPESHLIAADLLRWEREPEEVHRRLYANYTVEKLTLLMRALNRIQFIDHDRAAFVPMRATEFNTITAGGLDRDESGDVIDHVMNIDTVEVAALLREDGPMQLKLSLRSKGRYEVLALAESLGGGGHRFAAGAHLQGAFDLWSRRIAEEVAKLVSGKPRESRETGS